MQSQHLVINILCDRLTARAIRFVVRTSVRIQGADFSPHYEPFL
ncbi:hypothetical protein [Microcoleus sp. bin38.metabat.b11b12b14.051]|nr:hypothetical protein [Microcoleus sp. bin38.metabat.b11b12b14.051]